ncbi:TIGR03118 family protein [Frateuria defendens]|uniref:TIGR03118 family protein n=1 Tax=Frateuria defendens TaxID=2219559 RepID=UPI00069CDB9F|nr:TIGR03118 family protein [Frateuria defendens]
MNTMPSAGLRLCSSLALALALTGLDVAGAQTLDAGFSMQRNYVQHNLVSDGAVSADHIDPNLVNPWGVAFNPFGFVWVADNGTGLSTLYDGHGNVQSLVVAIPTPTAATGGNPTGIVYNGSNGFVVSKQGISGPARFIFATEDGVIAAWAPNVDLTHAVRAGGNYAGGAIYKGLALGAGGNGQLLYATDFFHARVDVFDASFQPVTLPKGAFTDPRIPYGFAPFGIQAIAGDIYVTYAKQGPGKVDDVAGPGLGFVDAYTPNGQLIRRVASGRPLNAPWGIALAPAGFGDFANALLIGNFGDGRINGFDLRRGMPLGSLRGSNHRPLEIEGLWGLQFGNGFNNQPTETLFFAAGPNDEENGLYGRIDVQP